MNSKASLDRARGSYLWIGADLPMRAKLTITEHSRFGTADETHSRSRFTHLQNSRWRIHMSFGDRLSGDPRVAARMMEWNRNPVRPWWEETYVGSSAFGSRGGFGKHPLDRVR